MAKILFGGGVAEMRGSEAGTTFSRNKGGSYTRQRVTPTNPKTAAQQAQRSRVSELASAWSNVLTQTQRDGWGTFAANFPTTDVFGAVIVLTGAQAFSRIGSRLMAAGLDYIADAPADQDVTDLVTVEATADIGAGGMEITFTPTLLAADDHLQVFCTPGISPGISNARNKLRLIATSFAAEAGPFDYQPGFLAAFGALPQVGQKLIIEVRSLRSTNGAIDSPLRADVLVTST